jgi:hypothetical protein
VSASSLFAARWTSSISSKLSLEWGETKLAHRAETKATSRSSHERDDTNYVIMRNECPNPETRHGIHKARTVD